jgi:hypothetical protein
VNPPFPQADRQTIDAFFDAVFRYADDGSFVQLRAFRDDAEGLWRRDRWRSIELNGAGLAPLTDGAAELAEACAVAPERVVLAAPAATFATPNAATERDVANGVVLMVECDERPEQAKQQLEELLGPATVAVASGGAWTDPTTGLAQPRLHLYWRLTEPTRCLEDHSTLCETCRLAAVLVGADLTAVPLCHPLRLPGSWHRKGDPPKPVRIIALNTNAEIELADALERLREAVGSLGHAGAATSAEPEADLDDISAALSMIPNDDLPWDQWNRIGMAAWRASAGSEEGFEAFATWSAKSSKDVTSVTRARWDHYTVSPPTKIGAGTLFFLARQLAPDWRKPISKPAAGRWTIDPRAPYETARLLRDEAASDGRPLRCYRGGFYQWNGAAYLPTEQADIRAVTYRFLRQCICLTGPQGQAASVRPNSKMVADVLDALQSAAIIPSAIELPV